MHTTTTISPASGARPRLKVLVGGRSAVDGQAPVRLGRQARAGRQTRAGRVGPGVRPQPAARPRLRLTRRGRLVMRWGGLLVAVLTVLVLVLVFSGPASAVARDYPASFVRCPLNG